ncbi:cytochrome c family protein [Acidobacteria bacterium AH-259-L09]|nr:cytochrome c family protein [Acidobacteria bacterium AH-259-L09]
MWLLVFVLLLISVQEQDPKTKEVRSEPIPQPVAFSHKLHMQLGLQCRICHRSTEVAGSAGLPNVSDCMICHRGIAPDRPEIQKLARYAREKKSIKWLRVYQVPYYVFFSHQNHRRAGIDCSACHGKVPERDALWREKDLSMAACIECHRSHEASIECHLCHALDQ